MQTCMPGQHGSRSCCTPNCVLERAHASASAAKHAMRVPIHLLQTALILLHRLPSITVTYQGLSVETDAAVGAAGIPTVARFLGGDLLAAAQRALAGGDAASSSVRLPVLRDVQGVLKPVRSRRGWREDGHLCSSAQALMLQGQTVHLLGKQAVECAAGSCNVLQFTQLSAATSISLPRSPQGRLTLLLGPPSSGKSVLMKTIAGQMEPSTVLRVRHLIAGCRVAGLRSVGCVPGLASIPKLAP